GIAGMCVVVVHGNFVDFIQQTFVGFLNVSGGIRLRLGKREGGQSRRGQNSNREAPRGFLHSVSPKREGWIEREIPAIRKFVFVTARPQRANGWKAAGCAP